MESPITSQHLSDVEGPRREPDGRLHAQNAAFEDIKAAINALKHEKRRVEAMGIISDHFSDAAGNPAGGITWGRGLTIAWQNGPLKEPNVAANGAFVEDVVEAAIDRIGYYQSSRFACEENSVALGHLRSALAAMNRRTSRRVAAGVEGTHRGN